MSKTASPRYDRLREMREAKFAACQKREREAAKMDRAKKPEKKRTRRAPARG